MLNIEYYKDKLIELGIINPNKLAVIEEQPRICNVNVMCDECLFNKYGFSCYSDALNWLFSEYKKPEVDWSKVKVDTPILVKDMEEEEWTNRYFAKFVDGKVYAWMGGATSWTADSEYRMNSWNYAKLAESEKQEDGGVDGLDKIN